MVVAERGSSGLKDDLTDKVDELNVTTLVNMLKFKCVKLLNKRAQLVLSFDLHVRIWTKPPPQL